MEQKAEGFVAQPPWAGPSLLRPWSLVLRLRLNETTAVLRLQPAVGRPWGFAASVIMGANSS